MTAEHSEQPLLARSKSPTLHMSSSSSMTNRRIFNSLPAFVRQNILILGTGSVLIVIALSFHHKVMPNSDDLAAFSDSIKGARQKEFSQFRHHKIYNYERYKPEEDEETSGILEVAFDLVSGKVGQAAMETGKKFNVYFREYTPKKLGTKPFDIVMLHGAAFTSLTWKQIETLKTLQKEGYRVVAVDLPGYGESPQGTINPKESALFVQAIFAAAGVSKAVLVSPSMSGRYAIPYVFSEVRKSSGILKGWIPVAPVSIRDHREEEYAKIDVKTFIVYGEKDSSGRAQSLQYLTKIPNSEIWGMIDGDHPCYMTNPEAWNKHIVEFLAKV